MAYSFNVTGPVWRENGGIKSATWTIAETEVAAGSEWDFPLPDSMIGAEKTITLYTAKKTAGSAATIQPKIGTATNPTSGAAGYLAQIATAAAAVRGPENIRLDPSEESIFGRSTPASASDNSVTTVITIALGHL